MALVQALEQVAERLLGFGYGLVEFYPMIEPLYWERFARQRVWRRGMEWLLWLHLWGGKRKRLERLS